MAKMFRKGKQLLTFDQLLEARTDGTGYVYWRGKLMSTAFMENMNFGVVRQGLQLGVIHRAIRKVPHAVLPAESG